MISEVNLAFLIIHTLLQFIIALCFYVLGRYVGREEILVQTVQKILKRKENAVPAGPIDYEAGTETEEDRKIKEAWVEAGKAAGLKL